MIEGKHIFGIVAIICITAIQISAFFLGHDGQIFTFCSMAIAAVVGAVLGISFQAKKSK